MSRQLPVWIPSISISNKLPDPVLVTFTSKRPTLPSPSKVTSIRSTVLVPAHASIVMKAAPTPASISQAITVPVLVVDNATSITFPEEAPLISMSNISPVPVSSVAILIKSSVLAHVPAILSAEPAILVPIVIAIASPVLAAVQYVISNTFPV